MRRCSKSKGLWSGVRGCSFPLHLRRRRLAPRARLRLALRRRLPPQGEGPREQQLGRASASLGLEGLEAFQWRTSLPRLSLPPRDEAASPAIMPSLALASLFALSSSAWRAKTFCRRSSSSA